MIKQRAIVTYKFTQKRRGSINKCEVKERAVCFGGRGAKNSQGTKNISSFLIKSLVRWLKTFPKRHSLLSIISSYALSHFGFATHTSIDYYSSDCSINIQMCITTILQSLVTMMDEKMLDVHTPLPGLVSFFSGAHQPRTGSSEFSGLQR